MNVCNLALWHFYKLFGRVTDGLSSLCKDVVTLNQVSSFANCNQLPVVLSRRIWYFLKGRDAITLFLRYHFKLR